MESMWKLLTLLENETSAAAQIENEEKTADENINIFMDLFKTLQNL